MNAASACRTRHLVALCVTLLCISAVALARGPENTHLVQVGAGWNLLSVPAGVANGSRAFLFPSAVLRASILKHPAVYAPLSMLAQRAIR